MISFTSCTLKICTPCINENIHDDSKQILSLTAHNYIINMDKYSIKNILKINKDFEKKHLLDLDYNNTIGLHIRRTDHGTYSDQKNWEIPDNNAFYIKIDEIMKSNPNINTLFIATDDTKLKEKLKEKYGDKLRYYNLKNNITRESDSITEAIVELLTLGKCEYIIGTSISSFSQIAGDLNKKKLFI